MPGLPRPLGQWRGYRTAVACREIDQRRNVGGDAGDARQPLRGTYLARYFSGGLFTGGTTLYVWRDNKSADTSHVSCGTVPSWAPLTEEPTLIFDEAEDAVSFSSADLNHDFGPLFDDRAQAWVTVVLDASGLYSVGFPAMMVEDTFGVP
ncbi:MAG: hypothetical protein GY856_09490 [bacterium]|nr:hypothetical protein [bacterium]